jgi:hypothetical protein
MVDKEPKTRQEEKGKGKFNKKHKECYNTKRVRSYEKRFELGLITNKIKS